VSDAILVVNAGSSSVKFSVHEDAEAPARVLRGAVSGLLEAPRFTARDAAGAGP